MKNCLLILAFMGLNSAFGQLNDTFSDGDLTSNPVWTGTGFQINGSQQLQTLNSGGSNQTVNLVTANTKVLNAVWEFYIQLNFDPSTSNQVRIYVVSTNSDLTAALNGYFLQIGESGSLDSYDLYRQDGLLITKIIDGPAKARASNTQLLARIRISRTIAGVWNVETDITGGVNYVSEGTQTDLTYLSTTWFGVQCKYTSSNSDRFYFDDFKIDHLAADNITPQLLSAKGVDTHNVEVTFQEPVTLETAMNTANYSLKNLSQVIGAPSSVKKTPLLNTFLLEYGAELGTDTYLVEAINMTDFNFNTQQNPNSATYYFEKPYEAQANDIVINEIFADPSPPVDLPELEFVELWNTSDYSISLDKWTFSDGNSTATLGNESLQAHQYVLLCATANVATFSPFGKVIGLSPWPSLNNSGDQLTLKNAQGALINQVNYADTWYKDALKKQGGWTLELIDPKAICTGIQNWSASSDISGGTPGKQNAIYQADPILEALQLVAVQLVDSVSLLVHYNRFVDSTSAATASHYSLSNGLGQPSSAMAIGPNFEEVLINYPTPLARGLNYTLTASQVSDCGGNLLSPPNNSAQFFLAEKIKPGDLLINELLFNPRTGGADFVEIYNRTDHPLNLQELRLATVDDQDQPISVKTISSDPLLIQPQEYRVLSTNSGNIQTEYMVPHPNRLIQIASMPAFNDDAGVVVLLRADSVRIDQLNYTEKMHFPLLKNVEGVSLERSSFSTPTNEPGNFRSAAASVDFATPGEQNSQFIIDKLSENPLDLSSRTLSPDNDGFEDALIIHYQFAQPGLVANLSIYSDRGILIKRLLKNTTLASEGNLVWEGLNEQNERVPIGIYLIRLEVFDLSGKVKTYLKTCVVATRLN